MAVNIEKENSNSVVKEIQIKTMKASLSHWFYA